MNLRFLAALLIVGFPAVTAKAVGTVAAQSEFHHR